MNDRKLNRIMIVEDEQDIQFITRISLERVGGYTVKACNSGIEALQNFKEFNPDLILMDVMMPDLDGPSTLKEFQKMAEFKDTKVIFMTAKAQAHEILNYKELGVVDVIVKPFDPMYLAQQVSEIWNANTNQA